MAVNIQEMNNSGKNINKHLALTKIVKIDLTKDVDSDDDIEYSPAYICTMNTCVMNSGTVSQQIQFQLLSMFNLIIFFKLNKSYHILLVLF